MIRTISDLEELSKKEQILLTGLARVTALIHNDGDTADQTIAKLYPKLRQPSKDKLKLVLEPILTGLK